MTTAYSLALVEPDETYARHLRSMLEAESFRVRWYSTTASAAAALQSGTFDLCVLGIDLPEVDGIDVCRTLRMISVSLPMIAVAWRPEDGRGVEALLAGADDVVARGVNARELVARIRAVLRRSGKKGGAAYEDDELTVLLDEMRAVVRGNPVALSRGETRVLAILLHEAPAPVSASNLRQQLSSEETLKQTTIEARIKSLRRKLGPHRIETRARLGYVFVLS